MKRSQSMSPQQPLPKKAKPDDNKPAETVKSCCERAVDRKNRKIQRLQMELENSSYQQYQQYLVLRDQRKVINATEKQQLIIVRQYKVIEKYRDEIKQLRAINWRSQRLIRLLKEKAPKKPEVPESRT